MSCVLGALGLSPSSWFKQFVLYKVLGVTFSAMQRSSVLGLAAYFLDLSYGDCEGLLNEMHNVGCPSTSFDFAYLPGRLRYLCPGRFLRFLSKLVRRLVGASLLLSHSQVFSYLYSSGAVQLDQPPFVRCEVCNRPGLGNSCSNCGLYLCYSCIAKGIVCVCGPY